MRKIKRNKILTDTLYSLDKLVLEFEIRKEDAQRLMDLYSVKPNVEQWVSNKLSVCRYNYLVALNDGNSFYILHPQKILLAHLYSFFKTS